MRGDNSIDEKKKVNPLKVFYIMSAIILTFMVTWIIILLIEPRPDIDGFVKQVHTYLETKPEVDGIDSIDIRTFKIYVNEKYFYLDDLKKAEYCREMGLIFTKIGIKHKTIKEHEQVYLYFYSRNGVEVAKPRSFGTEYEILY